MRSTSIGARLKRIREAKGMTQLALAAKARVAQGYISELEAGRKANPAALVVARLAKALGVPVTKLLG